MTKTADRRLLDRQIGWRIRGCRRRVRMNQQALADAVGVTVKMVRRYESGLTPAPASLLLFIARTLSVSINDLVDGIIEDEGAFALAEARLEGADLEGLKDAQGAVIGFSRLRTPLRRALTDLVATLGQAREDGAPAEPMDDETANAGA
jgi:transcriptional regulator with XRE-family HTH domain